MADTRIAELFETRQIGACILVEGYGTFLKVEKGHLVIHDGFGDKHRRTLRLSRVEQTVERIVVTAPDGDVSIAAMRWCAEVGIDLVVLDTKGRVLMCSAGTKNDGRLHQRQAAGSIPTVKYILSEKIHAQYMNCRERSVKNQIARLESRSTVKQLRGVEGKAGEYYFQSFEGTQIKIDGDVPDHWKVFDSRASVLNSYRNGFHAADPLNAMLNLAYSIGYLQAIRACHAQGLDPALGILHRPKEESYSMALDLLEFGRPVIDKMIFDEFLPRTFTKADFREVKQRARRERVGQCKVGIPLDREIINRALEVSFKPIHEGAEKVQHMLAKESETEIRTTTLVTKERQRAAGLAAKEIEP